MSTQEQSADVQNSDNDVVEQDDQEVIENEHDQNDEADSEEQTGNEELEEIEIDGVKFDMPKAQAEKLKAERMMHADYTRKTQELADNRKAFEAESQRTRETQQAYLNEYAKVVAIDDQLAEFNKVDWQTLIDTDPQLAQKLDVKRRELETARGHAVAAVTQKQQEFALNEQQAIAKQVQEAQAYVAREIPGWSAGRDNALKEYATAQGIDAMEIGRLAVKHPQLLKFIHKAELYDQLEKKRSAKPAPAPVKPVTQVSTARTGAQRDPQKMSTADWMKHRNSQVHKQR